MVQVAAHPAMLIKKPRTDRMKDDFLSPSYTKPINKRV